MTSGAGGAMGTGVGGGNIGGAGGVRPTAIVVSPSSIVLSTGTNEQLAATELFSDGSTYDVTTFATWTVDPVNVVRVSAGRVMAVGAGVAVVTASQGGLSGQAKVTVPNNMLAKIVLSPDPASAPVGGTVDFTATGVFSDGTMGNLNARVKWTVDDPMVAMLAANVATGVSVGTTTVHASIGTIGGSATLTIFDPRDR
jgi:hypothetical protein